jgi:hypothetical protein
MPENANDNDDDAEKRSPADADLQKNLAVNEGEE